MYAYLQGVVADKGANELVLDVGGVGYLLSVSMTTLQETPPIGEPMKAYTYLSVREDAMDLFGFATQEEKTMFLKLLGVSGIGPKLALAILGSMPLRDLNLAILMGDITALSRAPGIGKKTAQRIALELKDKISQADVDASGMPAGASPVPLAATDNVTEALEALIALGYSATEARNALAQVQDSASTVDQLIRQALRAMAGM